MAGSHKAKDSPKGRRDYFLRLLNSKHIDAAIVSDPRHVYYFTGYSTFWLRSTSLLILTHEESCLFIGESRVEDAKKVYDGRIYTFEDYAVNKRMVAYGGFVAEELTKFLKGRKILKRSRRIGLEDWHLPYAYAQAAKRASPKTRFTGISDMILSCRKTKGEDELRNLRRATERLELAYEVARANIAPGRTEIELCRDVMSDSILKHGPFEFSRGDTWVSGKRRTVERKGPPTNRIFHEGDCIILDLQSVENGYWADGARTYVVGKAGEKQQQIFNVLLKAKRKAEVLLRPGTTCRDIYNTVAREIDDAGFSGMFPHHAGHGVGLEDQEGPFFLPGSSERLEEGVVCTIEPGIYHPHVGGFRDEDMYVITKGGFDKLTVSMTKLDQVN
ncbi:MAG TPA: Xaa-Pro peptidase family protein [Candidatus Bathyarchaeia archaeon]|nr:Xaa-Pro peptidase family protein [Candidatus Bathyarchaeia archaeon]